MPRKPCIRKAMHTARRSSSPFLQERTRNRISGIPLQVPVPTLRKIERLNAGRSFSLYLPGLLRLVFDSDGFWRRRPAAQGFSTWRAVHCRPYLLFGKQCMPVLFGTWQAGLAHTGFANWRAYPNPDLRQFLHRLVGDTSQTQKSHFV